ncbi:TYR3-like protein [Mya arenaria]|uniref:TYR3-like protein n=1 Tax=Mya arenaria TaxID=6604 RepID=A0ABY7EU49_MYAAR|nr:TYR3-like protein [Mya arenaria]
MAFKYGDGQAHVCLKIPNKTSGCFQEAEFQPVSTEFVRTSCLQDLIWSLSKATNLSEADSRYFKELSERFLQFPSPKTGFRQRKEYRQLSRQERSNFHRALQILYEEGTIRLYAKLMANANPEVKLSPEFLGFQRVFLALVDDTVSLPYWDYTADFETDNPVNSILWTPDLLGNGNGQVVTGDFRHWRTTHGPLQRRYGESNYGVLISRDVIAKIMTKCDAADITYPIGTDIDEQYVMEYHQNGVFNWVGGTVADADTAAYDPVFYLISACTDHIWEVFQYRQRVACNKVPATDYPNKDAFKKMFGFSELINAHGYSGHWTTAWYNYTRAPYCPNCNSEFLWCDKLKTRCVADSRRNDFNIGPKQHLDLNIDTEVEYIPRKIAFPQLPSPFNDGRTLVTGKRDAKRAFEARFMRRRNNQVKPRVDKPSQDVGITPTTNETTTESD